MVGLNGHAPRGAYCSATGTSAARDLTQFLTLRRAYLRRVVRDANRRSIFICSLRLSESARPRAIDGRQSALTARGKSLARGNGGQRAGVAWMSVIDVDADADAGRVAEGVEMNRFLDWRPGTREPWDGGALPDAAFDAVRDCRSGHRAGQPLRFRTYPTLVDSTRIARPVVLQ